MRFFVLSDLHLKEEVETQKTKDRIKKLCAKIRKVVDIDERVLFIVLGDIVDQGKELSFDVARGNLSLILDELKGYRVEFEFVPGNHDLNGASLFLFDQLISTYGSRHSFQSETVYSNVHDGVNFIFADSTLSRDYSEPGKLDLNAISANIKKTITNILFCHHALSHGHGDSHDVIEDSATVIKKLQTMGISFFFHGHVHDVAITIPENGLIEIGCGSLSGGISWLQSVFNQFLVGYIQDGRIVLIERWIDTADGYGDFAMSELYPQPKDFSDPDRIGKISYDPVANYIPRGVSLYETVDRSTYNRMFDEKIKLPLRSAVQKHKKVLLLCDAGMGKSVELSNLAYELCDTYHTFFYLLENYTGQDIIDLLPKEYKEIPPNRIALILDGYDEIGNGFDKIFKNKLKSYVQDAPGANIIISSRTNFCGNENGKNSKTFSEFYVYALEKLDREDVQEYLESTGIDVQLFWNRAYAEGVSDLIFNPFYLISLSEIYAKENNLPSKKQLMDKLITKTFDVDDVKFSGELDEQYQELFFSLEMLAVAMQLMHRQVIDDRQEYQVLVDLDKRSLIKKSGLFKREGAGWKFAHNNFREYLAARLLSRLPKEFVIPVIFDGRNIKPYWVNALGYLTGFDLSWDLIDWLMESSPDALVKFESDRLNVELRIKIFKRIFEKYELERLHFNNDLLNVSELARFVNSNEILSFLLDKISKPEHYVSQYTAVNILREYPSLFDKENAVRETLVKCCEQYPVTDKTVCRLAMLALCQHKLQTEETTLRLMNKFAEINEDYIRLGIYEYLYASGEYDSYVEYYLSGIDYIAYKVNSSDENRIGNEAFELVKCLKKMSTVESVTCVLQWFSQESCPDFYASDEVLEAAIESAVNLYKQGYTELFEHILPIFFESTKVYNTATSNAIANFFVKTGTQYNAAILAADEFDDKPYPMFALIYADPSVIEYLKSAYASGSLKSHCAFREIVLRYVVDKAKYEAYASLIKEIDGIELPKYKAPIDYDALNRKSLQEYVEILLDTRKVKMLTKQLLELAKDPNITTKQLLEVDFKVNYRSVLFRHRNALYHYGVDVKLTEFFEYVDCDKFVLWSISRLLSKKSTVILTRDEKKRLTEILTGVLKTRNFENNIVYHQDSRRFTIERLTQELVSIILYLDYPIEENVLLNLTELPAYIFDENEGQAKYTYLKNKLSIEKLKSRLVQNVALQRVKGMVLQDHIEFFNLLKDPALAEYALRICSDQSDEFLRSRAWKYLYNALGAEYVASEILPIANGDLLIEIAGACKDISKEKLCEAMEREYGKEPSIQLEAYLITYESDMAISDYVAKIAMDKRLPEGMEVYTDGPTAAIGSICNLKFMPMLEILLEVVLDPEFVDGTWRSLRSSLVRAFANCGIVAYDETFSLVKKHCPSVDVNEDGYMYCNYIIKEIECAKRTSLDTAKTLSEVKVFLNKVKCII